MPPSHADTVHSAVEAINAGDWGGALATAAPNFEYDLTRTDSPLRGRYSRDEIPALAADFLGQWESATYEIHELIDAGDQLVTPFTAHFAGRAGIALTADATWLWTFRDAKLARLTLFQERAEALAAAGIGAA